MTTVPDELQSIKRCYCKDCYDFADAHYCEGVNPITTGTTSDHTTQRALSMWSWATTSGNMMSIWIDKTDNKGRCVWTRP